MPDVRIKRAADELIRDCSRRCPEFRLPFDLNMLIYDYLYEIDELTLDLETPLGGDGDGAVVGKMIPHKRLIMIDPSCVGQPFYRFTVAHEIGHWILHGRPLVGAPGQTSLFDDSFDFDTEFVTLKRMVLSHQSVRGVREEVQANKFASNLLMPGELVEKEFLRRFGSTQAVEVQGEEALLQVAQDFAARKIPPFRSLCEEFDTSRLSMAYRLLDLGLVGSTGALV